MILLLLHKEVWCYQAWPISYSGIFPFTNHSPIWILPSFLFPLLRQLWVPFFLFYSWLCSHASSSSPLLYQLWSPEGFFLQFLKCLLLLPSPWLPGACSSQSWPSFLLSHPQSWMILFIPPTYHTSPPILIFISAVCLFLHPIAKLLHQMFPVTF